MSKRITFIHLFNDYSGSPLVLATVIKGLRVRGYECQLMTSKHSEGFLSDLNGVGQDLFPYRFFENKLVRLLVFFYTQLILFFKVWIKRKGSDILYINTLLPFGAAIAGKLSGQTVIYHIHETSVKPAILKSWLRWVASKCASKSIFVSKYLCSQERLPGVPAYTVYNALQKSFIDKAKQHQQQVEKPKPFNVLMLCSLKAYKGVNEFVRIAERLPGLTFTLVLNANPKAIESYFKGQTLPANLTIYPSQSDVHPFYAAAHLVLNLSHPAQWIETFGMTMLEGMVYRIPCIVPQVGGPAEIVDHGINGYKLDQRDLEPIISHIAKLAMNKKLYNELANNARLRSRDFSFSSMISSVLKILSAENAKVESAQTESFKN